MWPRVGTKNVFFRYPRLFFIFCFFQLVFPSMTDGQRPETRRCHRRSQNLITGRVENGASSCWVVIISINNNMCCEKKNDKFPIHLMIVDKSITAIGKFGKSVNFDYILCFSDLFLKFTVL